MKPKMTESQDQVYNYLTYVIKEKGYPPSVREIASAVGLSPSSAQLRLNELVDLGYISRDSDAKRGIRINDDQFNLSLRKKINVPILKDGFNIDVLFLKSNILEYMPLLEESVDNADCFMITFNGDELKEAYILDGDKLLIGKQETANSGDLVMVYANDSIMIRRLYKDNQLYRLQTETKTVETIIVERLKIIGKVIGVFRKM